MILKLLKENSDIDISNFDWDKNLIIIQEHKLEGYIYARFKDRLPSEIKDQFKKSWQLQLLKNKILIDEFNTIKNDNLNIVGLKGIVFLTDLYQNFGERFLSDIDLWIPYDNSKIKLNGYQEIVSSKWYANSFKSTYQKNINGFEIVLELHQKLLFDIEYNFELSRKEEELIYIIGHLVYQHTFLKLNWLKDIDLFLNKYGSSLDWIQIERITKNVGLTNSLHMVLWVMTAYFDHREYIKIKNKLLYKILLTESFFQHVEKRFILYYFVKYHSRNIKRKFFKYLFFWTLERIKKKE